MEYDGIKLDKISPRYIFKWLLKSNYINDIELWLKMTDDSNLMSRTYNSEIFDQVLLNIRNDYFSQLDSLNMYFMEEKFK